MFPELFPELVAMYVISILAIATALILTEHSLNR